MRRLYFANLPYELSPDQFLADFRAVGWAVEHVHFIVPGKAIVRFANEEHAALALQTLAGAMAYERKLFVTTAHRHPGTRARVLA